MIAQILEHFGADLTRVSGENWRSMKCPFHDDRTASARVSLGRDAFACLACGVKGSAISLVMTVEKVEYADAVRIIEGITGEKVRGVRRSAKDDAPRPVSRWRETLFPGARD